MLVLRGALAYLCYTSLAYGFSLYFALETVIYDEKKSIHFLGGFVSFLLIWRLNQCYVRYENGKEQTSVFFSALHSIAGVSCAYLRGSDNGALHKCGAKVMEDTLERRKLVDGLAAVVKVNTVRLCLAIAIAFKYHCRVAENSSSGEPLEISQVPGVLFELTRLKGLLFDEERLIIDEAAGFEEETDESGRSSFVVNLQRDGNIPAPRPNDNDVMPPKKKGASCALPVLLMQLLRDCMMQAVYQKWGYPERILNVLEMYMKEITMTFEQLDRLITIPLPLAYLQHCKLLFLSFILTYPLTVNTQHGIWANVISPCILFGALLGFEVLADSMENPIGDDVLDLNIMRMIHDLESRLSHLMCVTDAQRLHLREAMCEPLLTMGMQPATSESNGSENPGEFYKHFAWISFPAHIIAYCGQKEYGVGDMLLRKAGLKADHCSCFTTKAQPSLDERERILVEEAEKYNLVTTFLCLERQRVDTDGACRQQLQSFLGLQEEGALDRGTSRPSVEGTPRDHQGYILMAHGPNASGGASAAERNIARF